jgi:hypothetical protein
MLRPLIAGSLLLALASIASSQSATSPDEALSPMELISALSLSRTPAPAKPPAEPGVAKKAKATPDAPAKVDRLTQCLRDWDAATHMTRQEWARTCRRVTSDRAQFMRDQDGK